MTRDLFFRAAEKASIPRTFSQAQRLVGTHFKLFGVDNTLSPYDVRTLEQLENHEVKDGVFAYLCRYAHGSSGKDGHRKPDPHFFRVCLQDHRILEALTRGGSFIRFIPLMLYIATHELVHILRFSRGECDFDMPLEKRVIEEEKVDAVTRSILKPLKDPGLDLVIDCFGDRYLLADGSARKQRGGKTCRFTSTSACNAERNSRSSEESGKPPVRPAGSAMVRSRN